MYSTTHCGSLNLIGIYDYTYIMNMKIMSSRYREIFAVKLALSDLPAIKLRELQVLNIKMYLQLCSQ